jgi:hypothetical protein
MKTVDGFLNKYFSDFKKVFYKTLHITRPYMLTFQVCFTYGHSILM